MSTVINEVLRGVYLDSVALMRISREIAALDGIEEAGLMVGTPANREILAEAGILSDAGRLATAGDLILAVRGRDVAASDKAISAAKAALAASRRPPGGSGETWSPRTLPASDPC